MGKGSGWFLMEIAVILQLQLLQAKLCEFSGIRAWAIYRGRVNKGCGLSLITFNFFTIFFFFSIYGIYIFLGIQQSRHFSAGDVFQQVIHLLKLFLPLPSFHT